MFNLIKWSFHTISQMLHNLYQRRVSAQNNNCQTQNQNPYNDDHLIPVPPDSFRDLQIANTREH